MNKINYPGKIGHTEIQASLWRELHKYMIDARLEVMIRTKPRGCFLDIVVFSDKQAVCIIECKSWSKSYLRQRKYQTAKNSKQIKRYQEYFGLPVLVCGCVNSIKPLVVIVQKLIYKANCQQRSIGK